MQLTEIPTTTKGRADRLGQAVSGATHSIGTGFSARHFSEDMFSGRMDPLLMVDHFVMTAPTFEPHLHAGISAVTAMFEDSVGGFRNRDTLGHNLTLRAGDLYWLAAASGAVHEEAPESDARIHALQIFVNLPARNKKDLACALHVEAKDVPVLEGAGHRVRVVLGRSGEANGAEATPEEFTMLDGLLKTNGRFSHRLPNGEQAWVYAVSGIVTIGCEGEELKLEAGTATTIHSGSPIDVDLESRDLAHFVLLAGKPLREPFVKYGPLVMSTMADVKQTITNHHEGRFGRIPA